jgi:phenylacetic acid degradation protein PaaD
MKVRQDMVNGHGICHGGFIFALADTNFAYACNSFNHKAVAAGVDINFIAPAHLGDTLTAVGSARHQGGRSGIYDIEVTNQDGKMIAVFRGRSTRIKGHFFDESEKAHDDPKPSSATPSAPPSAATAARCPASAPTTSPRCRSRPDRAQSRVDWEQVEDVIYGCANQAGEDNRNVARMAALLAGLPVAVPGATINRLCGSGMDAVGTAARAIKAGETALMIAGGVESMSRAPFVMPKAESAFSRSNAVYDTTIGWRFVNKLMKAQYGIDSMPETADNVAAEFKIARADQDAFALRSQQRWGAANAAGFFKGRDRAGRDRAEEGRAQALRYRRASAHRHHAGTTGQAKGHQRPRTDGHRRQRLGRQRRRLRPADRLGSRRQGPRPDARRRASWRWPPPAWRRASWASARRRR